MSLTAKVKAKAKAKPMKPIQESGICRQSPPVAAGDGSVEGERLSFTEPEPEAGLQCRRFLEYEAHALLTRLNRLKPFALQMTSVPAAAVSVEAQAAIERVLGAGRRELRERVG